VVFFTVNHLLRNLSLAFDGSVTSALCETLSLFVIPCNEQNLCETVSTAVKESWNLVLLSVTVEATCFAYVLPFTRCYTARCLINLSRRFREDYGTSCVTDYTILGWFSLEHTRKRKHK